MKKIKMTLADDITIDEGFNLYLNQCRARNYSEYTIKFYQNNIHNFSMFMDLQNKLSNVNRKLTMEYVSYLRGNRQLSDATIQTYVRALRTMLYYLMEEGYLEHFKIELPKADETLKETYTDSELKALLKKPDMKNISFAQYRNWVLVNYLLSTGQRLNTVVNMKIKDVDFDNDLLRLEKTKGRRQTLLPMSVSLKKILIQYVQFRKGSPEDYLFCTVTGTQMTKDCITSAIKEYNRSRGVERTSIHLFRHTYGKLYLMNGGDVFRLQKLMCHKDIQTTKGYMNLTITDLEKDFSMLNPLDNLSSQGRINMERESGKRW